MTAKQRAEEPRKEEPPEQEPGEPQISQWEFIGVPPTREQVLALLATLRPVWGVEYVPFADYVQALPQKKTVSKPHPNNPSVKVEERVDTWALYMSVAGRIKMCEAAAEMNGWRVDYEPEPFTGPGVPGFIELDEPRIVYREYVVIDLLDKSESGDERFLRLGRKPGMAWVPYSGGRQASGSNPYEKVETSARGRALAAWGFGVLPGSGIASVEEMASIRPNQAAMEPTEERGGRKSRGDLLQEVLQVSEELRLARGLDDAEQTRKLGQYLSQNLGVADCYDPEANVIDWKKVKDGQISVAINSMRDSMRRVVGEEHGL